MPSGLLNKKIVLLIVSKLKILIFSLYVWLEQANLFHTLCMVDPGISAWECWNFLVGERSFSDHCISCKLLMGLVTRNVVLSRVSFTLVVLLKLSLFG